MLAVSRMSKRYGSVSVLDGVDLCLDGGSITAVLGPSGAGKSTLLRCLAFVDPPTDGRIHVDGRAYEFPSPRTQPPSPWPDVVLVFSEPLLWSHLTLRENVDLVARYNRVQSIAVDLDDLWNTLELRRAQDLLPHIASSGMRQRAALIRALAAGPKYLLCDELTSALDVESISRIIGELRRHRARGGSVLLVTHSIALCRAVADRVCFLDRGRLLFSGPVDEVATSRVPRLVEFLDAAASYGAGW